MTDDDKALRLALAERLAASGHLRTDPWRAAVESVPRHEFLRSGYFERTDNPGPTAWRPVLPDDPGWLGGCYQDASLVTQIAGTIAPRDIRGEILREPTSSSTLPGLVVRMLEDLQVEDGNPVLEIGTGTGYSTGLLCHRLGEDLVTSMEVDPEVSIRARAALGHAGYAPFLITGDGLACMRGWSRPGPAGSSSPHCPAGSTPPNWPGSPSRRTGRPAAGSSAGRSHS
ncbi:hypothetical protein [Streptomyces bluensis]|uniref:hypothetical protein n=1 Tax=Streptomyces bluensis TaxID=33897 RepID=UPI0033291349